MILAKFKAFLSNCDLKNKGSHFFQIFFLHKIWGEVESKCR